MEMEEKWKGIGIVTTLLAAAVLLAVVFSAGWAASPTGASDANGIAITLVSQTPDPAAAGQIVDVRLAINNNGGKQADNLTVWLDPAYPIVAAAGESLSKYVGTLQGYQGVISGDDTQIVKFTFLVDKEAAAGTYRLSVNYANGAMSGSTDIDISVAGKKSVEISSIDKTLLTPGNETTLTFTLRNAGSSSLSNLAFSWENPDGIILPVGSDNTKYVSSLPVGGSAQVSYVVVADSAADAGLYGLDLSLTYDDSATGTTQTVSTLAGIYVGGGTDFDVAYSDSSSGTMSFSIANIGSNPAYSVSISVPEQAAWRVTGSRSSMIGNLNKGDYTSTSFVISQASARASFNSTAGRGITLEISYTDTTGARRTVAKEVAVSLASSSNSTSAASAEGLPEGFPEGFAQRRQVNMLAAYGGYFAGGLAVVLLAGGYLFYRSKKKNDPDLTVGAFLRGLVPAGTGKGGKQPARTK